jgi:exoribonuclease II
VPQGELQVAWEILAGGRTRLSELAELAFGAYTPQTAWAAWQQVSDGVYFTGSPDAIEAYSPEEVARRQHEREQATAGRRAWQGLIERVKQARIVPEDRDSLREVEALALERSERSQVLRALNRSETPENAHSLLMELGVWNEQVNPYPLRSGLPLNQPDLPVPDLPQEERRDLTHLLAFAIDDAGTDTPDDALSLEGGRLWVHVADVAALVTPDSALDLEARARGSSLHLPEGTIHLLPREITHKLGLGLAEKNPALSIGIDLSEYGEVLGFEVVPSWVKVSRLTYESANDRMEEEPFRTLEQRLAAVRERRKARGAVLIDFPETKLDVVEGQVQIQAIRTLRSRTMVEEAMILASSETARYASQQGLAMAFSQQEPTDSDERPTSPAGMFGLRRQMKRSRFHAHPGPHSGLGVAAYSQVTSPLRRYLDLVGHQQLRAHLCGLPLLDEGGVMERIGAVESVLGSVRQVEAASEKHWTLVYLLQHPDWQGEGIVVDRRGASGIVMVPELAWEARVHLPSNLTLDQAVRLRVTGIQLALREASWRVEGPARPARSAERVML